MRFAGLVALDSVICCLRRKQDRLLLSQLEPRVSAPRISTVGFASNRSVLTFAHSQHSSRPESKQTPNEAHRGREFKWILPNIWMMHMPQSRGAASAQWGLRLFTFWHGEPRPVLTGAESLYSGADPALSPSRVRKNPVRQGTCACLPLGLRCYLV